MDDAEKQAHDNLLRALHEWSTVHMDQWEMLQFNIARGIMFVKITQAVGDGWNYTDVTDQVLALSEAKP